MALGHVAHNCISCWLRVPDNCELGSSFVVFAFIISPQASLKDRHIVYLLQYVITTWLRANFPRESDVRGLNCDLYVTVGAGHCQGQWSAASDPRVRRWHNCVVWVTRLIKKTSLKTAGSPENVRRPKLHLSVKRSLRTAGARCVSLCALQFVVRCVCMFRPEYIISAQHVLYSFSHVVTTHCVIYNCNSLFGGRYSLYTGWYKHVSTLRWHEILTVGLQLQTWWGCETFEFVTYNNFF